MQNYPLNLHAFLASFWKHRQLITTLVKREISSRYRGSILGPIWSVLNPVFMLAVYTFVFSVVFQARWSTVEESRAMFALVLFAGLLIFNFFADCVTRAPTLIVENANYVKKVIFPLEILPWVSLGTAFFNAFISFLVWVLFSISFVGVPPITIFLFPLILIPLILFIMGLSWLLASLGVYLRDITQFVSIVTMTLMFLTPIFYPLQAIPTKYHFFILSNPLAFIVEQARAVMIFGKPLNWSGYLMLTCSVFLFAWSSFAWFQKTRKGFADVL
ncbi:MAG: ABC transporter permease [Desulfuromonas sp.]|nr:ABC transporter permease [Desulfuromonas sp.]